MKRLQAQALIALTLYAGAASVWAQDVKTTKADTTKGQAIATQVCAACHGADGNSAVPVNPNLAGQIPEYLHKQLVNFKAQQGKQPERVSPVMNGMVANLSTQDMANVAAYYAGQAPKQGAARSKDSVALGQKLWRAGDASKGLPACAGCHNANGVGVPAQFPRLAGQYADYTEAQLKAFGSGARANDANKVMRSIAARMSESEMKAVADYAAGLR